MLRSMFGTIFHDQLRRQLLQGQLSKDNFRTTRCFWGQPFQSWSFSLQIEFFAPLNLVCVGLTPAREARHAIARHPNC